MVNQIHKRTMPAFIGLGGVSLSLCLPSLSDSLLPPIHLNSFSPSLSSRSLPSSFSPLLPSSLTPPLSPFLFFPASFSPRCSTKNKVVILVSSNPFKRLQLWRRQQQVALLWKLYCMAVAAAAPAPAQIPQTMPRQVQVSRPFPCTFPF